MPIKGEIGVVLCSHGAKLDTHYSDLESGNEWVPRCAGLMVWTLEWPPPITICTIHSTMDRDDTITKGLRVTTESTECNNVVNSTLNIYRLTILNIVSGF